MTNPTDDTGGLNVEKLSEWAAADGDDEGMIRVPVRTLLRLAAESLRFREVRRAYSDGRADLCHDARCGPGDQPYRKNLHVGAHIEMACDCGAWDLHTGIMAPIVVAEPAPTPRELARMAGEAASA
jgi:hypothetical protein